MHLIAWVSAVATVVAVGASVVLVPRVGLIGVPLAQLGGIVVATPWLLRGIGPGVATRVLRGASAALGPLVVAGGVGLPCLMFPLTDGARGLVAAAAITIAYVATAWWTGPAWLRTTGRDEWATLRFG